MATPNAPKKRKLILAMKAEAVYGTDIFAGTYLQGDVLEAVVDRPKIVMEEIPVMATAGSLGRMPSVIGVETAEVTFEMVYRGRTVAFDDSPTRIAPNVDLPFRGCALNGVFSVANAAAFDKLTWSPTSTPESMTLYVIQEISGQANATVLKILGAYGTVSGRMRSGGELVLRFTFRGKNGGRADVAYVAGAIATLPQYPVAKSAALTYDGNAAFRVASFAFDLGGAVTPIIAMNDGTGVAGYHITDRNVRVNFDPEADRAAIYDWYSKWRAGLPVAFSVLLGALSPQWNKLTISFPKLQIVDQEYGERDGLTSWPTVLQGTIQSGEDDLSLEAS